MSCCLLITPQYGYLGTAIDRAFWSNRENLYDLRPDRYAKSCKSPILEQPTVQTPIYF